MKMKQNYGNGANYSTTSDALLCKVCSHGQVIETDSGNTMIVCRKSDGEGTPALVLNCLVTKCTLFEEKKNQRMWADASEVEIEDGHAWIQRQIPGFGRELIRVDSLESAKWYVRGYTSGAGHDWGLYNRVTRKWENPPTSEPPMGFLEMFKLWWQGRLTKED